VAIAGGRCDQTSLWASPTAYGTLLLAQPLLVRRDDGLSDHPRLEPGVLWRSPVAGAVWGKVLTSRRSSHSAHLQPWLCRQPVVPPDKEGLPAARSRSGWRSSTMPKAVATATGRSDHTRHLLSPQDTQPHDFSTLKSSIWRLCPTGNPTAFAPAVGPTDPSETRVKRLQSSWSPVQGRPRHLIH